MRTTKASIIEELYTSKEFNECIGRMDPEHLREDLKAEVILIMCELEEKRVLEMHGENRLKFFAVRTILNLIQSSTSPFYKKYRRLTVPVGVNTRGQEEDNENPRARMLRESEVSSEIDTRLQRELKEDRVMGLIDNLYWYDKAIVQLYIKLGNYRAIEKETGIPWESCYSTVRKAINKIREHIKQSHAATS